MRVLIIGRGQVGRALSAAFRRCGYPCRNYGYRAGLPRRFPEAELMLLCTRDGQLPEVVAAIERAQFDQDMILAHVAGAIGPECLAPLRGRCAGVAQMHPYASILAKGPAFRFESTPFVVTGDKVAVRRIRGWLRELGALAICPRTLDRARYHLSAVLLANGAVALANLGERLLGDAGIARSSRGRLATGLLESVLGNIGQVGSLNALTGPVRRGDVGTLERHLALLGASYENLLPLYRALAEAQLEVVSELGELTARERRRVRDAVIRD